MDAAASGASGGYSPRRAIALGGSGLAVCLMPVFLTGALAVEMTRDLHFGAVGLGAAVAAHRLASAMTAVFAGRLADHLGAVRSMRLAVTTSGLACAGLALTAHGWTVLALWLALSGCAMSLADPAGNRLLVNVVPPNRLGRAFGFKQSSPPAATMLAGLSVPLVAALVGWRWAFVITAAACVVIVLAVGRAPTRSRRSSERRERIRLHDPVGIVLLSAALGLGSAASATVPAFFVSAAADAGSSTHLAGWLLAAASVVTVLTRVVAGLVADRMTGRHLLLCASGQIVGAVGLVLLSSHDPRLVLGAVVLALAGTWGFHGVFWFAAVRTHPATPGAITGAVAPGAFIGGVAGPMVFGAIAAGPGYTAAWTFAAGLSVCAAAAMLVAARRLGTDGLFR